MLSDIFLNFFHKSEKCVMHFVQLPQVHYSLQFNLKISLLAIRFCKQAQVQSDLM